MGVLQAAFDSDLLQPVHRDQLISAFEDFVAVICKARWQVGQILQQNIATDSLTTDEMAAAFWKCLDDLLSQLNGGKTPELSCCNPHREKARALQAHWMREGENAVHSLLVDLMEVTYLMARPARWRIGSSVSPGADQMQLVRFMELRRFLYSHYADRYRPSNARSGLTPLEKDFMDRLHPKFPPPVRMAALERSPLGLPSGCIGTLPDSSRSKWCGNVIPFATPAEEIDQAPQPHVLENILRKLGLPFHAGEYFVEIRYDAKECKPIGGANHSLAVPAFPDACYQPFWWPRPDADEDAKPRYNLTREIPQNVCGLKELLHLPVPARKAVLSVWPEPTTAGWAQSR